MPDDEACKLCFPCCALPVHIDNQQTNAGEMLNIQY